jgi:hypothetical protein
MPNTELIKNKENTEIAKNKLLETLSNKGTATFISAGKI